MQEDAYIRDNDHGMSAEEEREHKTNTMVLALHKEKVKLEQELKQDMKSQKIRFENQIRVARGELPPTQLDREYQVETRNESERKSQRILDSLRKSTFDVTIARATITFMLGNHQAMESHAKKAAQISSPMNQILLYEQCHYIIGVALYYQKVYGEAHEAFQQAMNRKAGVSGISNKTAGEWMKALYEITVDTPSQTPNQTLVRTHEALSFSSSVADRPMFMSHPSDEDDDLSRDPPSVVAAPPKAYPATIPSTNQPTRDRPESAGQRYLTKPPPEDAKRFATERTASLRNKGAVPAWSPEYSSGIGKRRDGSQGSKSPKKAVQETVLSNVTRGYQIPASPIRRAGKALRLGLPRDLDSRIEEHMESNGLNQQRNPNVSPGGDALIALNGKKASRPEMSPCPTAQAQRQLTSEEMMRLVEQPSLNQSPSPGVDDALARARRQIPKERSPRPAPNPAASARKRAASKASSSNHFRKKALSNASRTRDMGATNRLSASALSHSRAAANSSISPDIAAANNSPASASESYSIPAAAQPSHHLSSAPPSPALDESEINRLFGGVRGGLYDITPPTPPRHSHRTSDESSHYLNSNLIPTHNTDTNEPPDLEWVDELPQRARASSDPWIAAQRSGQRIAIWRARNGYREVVTSLPSPHSSDEEEEEEEEAVVEDVEEREWRRRQEVAGRERKRMMRERGLMRARDEGRGKFAGGRLCQG
ncbi:hypothetical protein N7G274_007360 [Stereocaulon virgatum]|uniref:Uncharacterized protein n=1 Tax=Stereocaulon virgatum TaxID=373712 RepID=A0ABR4A1Y2_9LECA